jgi:hypothetical protein
MTPDLLSTLDFTKATEPDPDQEMRDLLVAWLDYQRHEFLRKLRDLSPEQIVEWSVPPVELSVIGLVRHMQQMEHVYLAWGLGGGERHMIYGEDDYAGGSVETIDEDLSLYLAEVERADAAIAAIESLDEVGLGHSRPLGATLIKMIHEYTLHSGQAHMLRFTALGEIIR